MTLLTQGSAKSGYCLTLVNFMKGMIGAGLFAMGEAFRCSGLLIGCILTIFLGVVNTYSNHLLIQCANDVKERKQLTEDPSFADVAELSFENGPKYFKKWSTTARRVVKTFVVVTQLGFCCIYFVFISQTAQTIALQNGLIMNIRIYVVIVFPIIVMTCMIRTIKLLAPISLLSNILIITGIICTVAMSAIDLPSITERQLVSPISGWPLFIATTIFSFEGISLIIPLRNSMEDPKKFVTPLGVLNVTMGITIGIILSVGFIGYLKYGDDVKGSLTLNLPGGGLSVAVQIMVGVGVMFTYALQFFIAADIIWKKIEQIFGTIKHPNVTFILMKIALILLTACLAAIIPHLNQFISLVGALCSTTLALVVPPVCDIALTLTRPSDEAKSNSRIKRYTLDALILLVAVVGFFLGSYCSIKGIVQAFQTGED